MVNSTVLVGRLTKDPELRRTQSDIAVTSFRLAVNRPFTNKQGEQEADFIQVVVWRKQAENVQKYVKKGSLVGVEGRIQTRSFDDNQGNRKFVVEVVADSVAFLDTKPQKDEPEDTTSPYDYEKDKKQNEEIDPTDFDDGDGGQLPF